MLNDLDFAPTHVRADYCDAADEASTQSTTEASKVSPEAVAAWERDPWF